MFQYLNLYRESSGKSESDRIFYGSFPSDSHNRLNLMRVPIEIKATSINENFENFELPITLYLSRNICMIGSQRLHRRTLINISM